MNFIHENLEELKKRLINESLFNKLDFDEQEELIKKVVDKVQEYSKDFETRIVQTGREGIECEITYDTNIIMQAKCYYNVENKYTGTIQMLVNTFFIFPFPTYFNINIADIIITI